jgi:hypothetical protein
MTNNSIRLIRYSTMTHILNSIVALVMEMGAIVQTTMILPH